jgi:predicted DNA-binding transcriptional regulator AlpA
MTARAQRVAALPASLPPRGLSHVEAATYIGVSPTTFAVMVEDGRMPRPKRVGNRRVWDRTALDLAFASLPDERADGSVGTPTPDPWTATL